MRVLFSPLGLSKGSLFTAIVRTQPDRVVVITSQQGSQFVDEITAKAKEGLKKDFTVEVYTVSDPFNSFVEGRGLAKAIVNCRGDENIVNLTGGPTALQDVVQCIARLLDAKEVAVFDRRPYSEQQENPYWVGEMVEVPKIT